MAKTVAAGAGLVLFTLGVGQFLMILDSSVMNVSMVSVAKDTNTTITGIQTAITMYTLVMASLMITGGKIGAKLGHLRAFRIGCVIYGAGSLVTGVSTSLAALLIGWSLLEGMGAALILPAIVALVANNFAAGQRAKAYGLIASAGAMAMALGPLIGGFTTTYFTWRWVFIGEVVLVVVILALSSKMVDSTPASPGRLDIVGTLLSIAGLGMSVFAILRSSEWGWVVARSEDSGLFGISYTFWMLLVGIGVMRVFFWWEARLIEQGRDPLIRPDILRFAGLQGGLLGFFFQFMLQAGIFFAIPLFLSIVLELSPIETGLRVVPLSVSVLIAAIGIPRVWPKASPRRVVRIGLVLMLVGIVALMSGIDIDADASIVAIPMVLIGLGMGSLSSQLGAVTVSSVPKNRSGEVGGLQNTASNLGASLGTALTGSIIISVLASTLLIGVSESQELDDQVKDRVTTQLTTGVQFISSTALEQALEAAGAPDDVTEVLIEQNRAARLHALDTGLAVLALVGTLALFVTRKIPLNAPQEEQPD
jgi:MFS family permease